MSDKVWQTSSGGFPWHNNLLKELQDITYKVPDKTAAINFCWTTTFNEMQPNRINLSVVQLSVHVDLSFGDVASKVRDGVGDV